ncbi:MAG: NUDIX domain-containing protein [Actinomycetota bacterium]
MPARRDGPTPRAAVRLLTVDARERVLLFGYRNPTDGEEFWVTPGGGMEPGESLEDTARREFLEETGHPVLGDLGDVIWRRSVQYEWDGEWLRQSEVFFLYRVPELEVDPDLDKRRRQEGIIGHGWFTLDELEKPVGFSPAPRRIAELTRDILRDGPPLTPIATGL